MEPVTIAGAWLLAQAIRLIAAPIGEAARDAFGQQIGKQAGDWAMDRVRAWFHSPPATQSEVAELEQATRDVPELGEALTQELSSRLGVQLARGNASQWTGTDAFVLDAYSAIHWRVAALAYLEQRPVAIAGGLQGDDWVTVCQPDRVKILNPGALPEPGDTWYQEKPDRVRRPPQAPAAEFLAAKASGDAIEEAARLNREFRLRGYDAVLPGDREGGPLQGQYFPIDGFAPLWVALRPALSVLITMPRRGSPGTGLNAADAEYDDYPSAWRPFIDIPDEARGISALSAGADDAAAASRRLRERIESILRAAG